MPTIADKRRAFRALHAEGCFALPNPWDVGSARYLQHLGFPALATTSAGAAFAQGLPDGGVPLEAMLAHIHALAEAADVPVNADFGAGYADEPAALAENARRCVMTGVAGLSIEDATGDPAQPLYDLDHAVARIAAVRAVTPGDVVLTARCECFLVSGPDLDETIRRLQAYAAAGADCLYAPGLRAAGEVVAVVTAVAPRPVNVLVSGALGLTLAQLGALGVRRASVGSGLARAAWGGFIRAARAIADGGRFDALGSGTPFAELDGFFAADARRRGI